MGEISVRKGNGDRPLATTREIEWEPARLMRSMLGWDPFREMAALIPEDRTAFLPAFEVKENKDGYVFKADLPGVKEGDLEVTVTGNRLNISGKREAEREEKGETFYTYERQYGSFTRAFTLPEGADMNGVRAELKEGVLTIALPKLPELQPKKVPVETPVPPPPAKA